MRRLYHIDVSHNMILEVGEANDAKEAVELAILNGGDCTRVWLSAQEKRDLIDALYSIPLVDRVDP